MTFVGRKDFGQMFLMLLNVWATVVAACDGAALRRHSPPTPAAGKGVTWVE